MSLGTPKLSACGSSGAHLAPLAKEEVNRGDSGAPTSGRLLKKHSVSF